MKVKQPSFASRTRLIFEENRVRKYVTDCGAFIGELNSVGAIGYAVVVDNPAVPANDFFVPQRRFRIRFRYKRYFFLFCFL